MCREKITVWNAKFQFVAHWIILYAATSSCGIFVRTQLLLNPKFVFSEVFWMDCYEWWSMIWPGRQARRFEQGRFCDSNVDRWESWRWEVKTERNEYIYVISSDQSSCDFLVPLSIRHCEQIGHNLWTHSAYFDGSRMMNCGSSIIVPHLPFEGVGGYRHDLDHIPGLIEHVWKGGLSASSYSGHVRWVGHGGNSGPIRRYTTERVHVRRFRPGSERFLKPEYVIYERRQKEKKVMIWYGQCHVSWV